MLHAQLIAAKCEPRFAYVHHGGRGARDQHELNHAQTDGAGADHEDEIVGLHFRTFHRVRSNSERFDKRELFIVELVGAVKFLGWDGDKRAHATVDVHAQRFEFSAAIGFAPATRDAAAAI
ncbi:MAG: hypothetical protein ABIZ81_14685 [Opitutaceae bacterium]